MYQKMTIVMTVLLLVAKGCGAPATPAPTTAPETVALETESPTQPSPTATLLSPSPTPVPPTNTPEPSPTPRPVGWVTVETGNSPVARAEHAMVPLPDGGVLLFGGRDENGNILGDTWVLTRKSPESWNQIPAPDSPSARYGHSMVTLDDGRVLMFGGEDYRGDLQNSISGFRNQVWDEIVPVNAPPPPRRRAIAWAYDNKMYISGGIGKKPNGDLTLYEDLWRFDASTNAWTQLEDPPDFISPHAFPVVYDNKAYLLDPHSFPETGGRTQVYDMNLDRWEYVNWTCQQWPTNTSWFGGVAVQVGDKVYAFGGERYYIDTQSEADYITEAWKFDAETRDCERIEDMPLPMAQGDGVWWGELGSILLWGGRGPDEFVDPRLLVYYTPPSAP